MDHGAVFLPVVSAIAYFVIEILPGLQGNRHVRTARANVVAKIDPERDVRAARRRSTWPTPQRIASGWRMPSPISIGISTHCRSTGLLLELGYEGRARRVLEEVEARMKRLDRHQRAAEADMYRWASDALADLRARGSA